MKVKWTDPGKKYDGVRIPVALQSDVDWVRLGPDNKMCYATNEGTRVEVVTYIQLEILASPGYEVHCAPNFLYYESVK